MQRKSFIQTIFNSNGFDFESTALQLFKYQYINNQVYKAWVDSLNVKIETVTTLEDIPYLPISAFKIHKVQSFDGLAQEVFSSSGTTGSVTSKHYVKDIDLYLKNTIQIFNEFYTDVNEYCFLALLPSYLERTGSSLIAMVDQFISLSVYEESGFYLYNHQALYARLLHCKSRNIPTVLFGVSFALLDFIKEYSLDFPSLTIIETGGMKGRKKEMTRSQLHDSIACGFGIAHVHSEYGMTELFSQAYSKEEGIFYTGSTMNVSIREVTDPFQEVTIGRSGIINIIDLANIDSCAFIETEDLGRSRNDGSFEVLGRIDSADLRGCNLMVSDI